MKKKQLKIKFEKNVNWNIFFKKNRYSKEKNN